MPRTADRNLLFAIVLAVVVTLGNAVLAFRNLTALARLGGDVGRSRTVLLALDQIDASVREAETAQRGYVLTGETSYVEPYYAAAGRLPGQVQRADSLIADDTPEQDQLNRVRELLTEKMAEMRETIDLRGREGFAAAEALVHTGRGKAAMDTLQAVIGQMAAAEQQRLDQHQLRASAAQRASELEVVLAVLLELATLAVLAMAFRQRVRDGERHAAALHDQKELFRTTLASIGDAVIATDVDGKIIFINPVAETLTGWPVADATARRLEDVFNIVNETSRAPVANPAMRALAEGAIVGLANHTLLLARDGCEYPIHDSAAPIRDAAGAIIGAVLVFRDITEAREAERQLHAADRRKDEFLAVLSHELRNPLAPLRNGLEILRLAHHDAAAVEQVGGIMERQLQQMVRLIDDLLDISRVTRSHLELRRAPVDVTTVVHAALETCAPLLRDSGHTLQTTLPSTPLFVDADRTRLAQAFGNLLSNAIKYTDAGGRIWLTVGRDGDHAVIGVRDTGIGIPADMLTRIFEMFVQVDRSLERTRGGLGIGLALVKQIVDMHGGSIVATSGGPGAGSEFTIRLPLVPAPSRGARVSRDGEARPHRRILVADDNPDAASSLGMMLRMMGHEVRLAHDGTAALAEAEAFRPDVALLDIGMPRLNGYDVARAIRQQPWGAAIRLVALTGWGADDDRDKSRVAGFDQHLVKPVEIAALQDAIAG